MDLDFGAALQGVGTAANGLIDQRMKQDADTVAADRKLDDATRLLAAQQALNNQAAVRFSSVVQQKMQEQVPVTPAPVTTLGAQSAQAVGLQDGIQGGSATIAPIVQQAQATLTNPTATADQKQQAQEIITQIGQQTQAQGNINSQAADGQMRNRTAQEAARAAMEETLATDAPAYMAGTAMVAAGNKDDIEQKRLDQKDRISQAQIDQKDRADNMRFDALLAKIDANQGKGPQATALIQNAEYLKQLGYTPDKIENFIFDKKQISLDDVAAKILAGDKFGEMTPEQAANKAVQIRTALDKLQVQPGNTTPTSTTPRPPLSSFQIK